MQGGKVEGQTSDAPSCSSSIFPIAETDTEDIEAGEEEDKRDKEIERRGKAEACQIADEEVQV